MLKLQKGIYKSYGFSEIDSLDSVDEYDIIIDAIFGVGLNRSVEEPFSTLINTINKSKAYKIAIDVASGINSDNGEVLKVALKANETYTFAFEKVGQLLWPGFDYTGDLSVLEMGINKRSWGDKKPHFLSLERKDLSLLKKRCSHSNKGTYGRVLVIAGLSEMAGAAVLSSKAAYATGAGLVKVLTASCNRDVLLSTVPEAIFQSVHDYDLQKDEIIEAIGWADSVVIGPGNGVNQLSKNLLRQVLKYSQVPVVIDADAINVISEDDNLWNDVKCDIVITPHLKEMSRLINEPIEYIQRDIIGIATDFSNSHDCVCVLKDFHTIVALPYGQVYINQTGNNGMATAGSGDVLSGIIGALLASGEDASKAAAYGVFIHGLAGDFKMSQTGYHGLMANDIIDGLKMMWSQVDIDVKE